MNCYWAQNEGRLLGEMSVFLKQTYETTKTNGKD